MIHYRNGSRPPKDEAVAKTAVVAYGDGKPLAELDFPANGTFAGLTFLDGTLFEHEGVVRIFLNHDEALRLSEALAMYAREHWGMNDPSDLTAWFNNETA